MLWVHWCSSFDPFGKANKNQLPKTRLPDFLRWYLHPKFYRNMFPIFLRWYFCQKHQLPNPKVCKIRLYTALFFFWKEMWFFHDLETLHIFLFASYDWSPKSGLMNFGGVYLSIPCLMFIVSPLLWWVHWDSLSFGFSTLLDRAKCNLLFPYLLSISSILLGYCWLYHVTSKFSKKIKNKWLVIPIFLLGTYILLFFLCSKCWSYNDYNVGFTQFHKPFPSGYGSKPWYPNGTHSIIAFEWINGNIPLHRPKK